MTAFTRRDFLKVAAVGGGLVLTISLPGCKPKAGSAPAAGPIDPSVFVRINPDNSIVITVAKSEMGQGFAPHWPCWWPKNSTPTGIRSGSNKPPLIRSTARWGRGKQQRAE